MAKLNPRIGAPWGDTSVKKLEAFQDSGSDKVYKCTDSRHKRPLIVSKLGMRCSEADCRYEQKWAHMFLGEDGEEAIMPLKRMSNGNLGIEATHKGGTGSEMNVIINNYSSSEVETQRRANNKGGFDVEVMIKNKVKDLFNRGEMDRTMSGNYGLRRTGVNRG